MTELEREIKKYRILVAMRVRASGSKRGDHPHRALWGICGKPMIQWSLEAAKGCKYVDKIAVATEDRAVRDAVEEMGILVIDRPLYTTLDYPRNFATGVFGNATPRSLRSKIPDVLLDAHMYIRYWLREKEGYTPDIIIRMVASHPMVTTDIFNRLVEAFFKDKEAILAETFYPGSHYLFFDNPKTGGLIPLMRSILSDRQDCPDIWIGGPLKLYGMYEYAESQIAKNVPVFITAEEGLDVHNEEDLFLARCYMKHRLIKASKEVKWEIGQDDLYENTREEKKR